MRLLLDSGVPNPDLTEDQLRAICCGPDLPERALARYIWRMHFLNELPPWIKEEDVHDEYMGKYTKLHWLTGERCSVCDTPLYRTQQADLSAGITCRGGHSLVQREAALKREEPAEEGFE